MKKTLFLISALCAGLPFYAQEKPVQSLDSVYIDAKVERPRKSSGKVVTTISKETLQQNAGMSVASLLNQVSGIEINGARSNDGQNLAYYIRGGRNRQVVIMVDGVPLTDASQIANDYDLRLIPTETIEKIEIIKGASSVLYGSGAGTAVINITTKKAAKKPISATFSSMVGTNQSAESDSYRLQQFTNSASVNGRLGGCFYNAQFGNRYTDGLSAIAAPEGEEAFESDVFNRFNGRINVGYRFSDDVVMSQFFSFDEFKAGFDDFSYTDAEHRSITKQLKTGGHFEWRYKNGTYVFNDSFTWLEREIESGFPAKYESDVYSMDTYLNHQFSSNFSVLVGLNVNLSSVNTFTIPFGETDFVQALDEEEANFNIIDPYLNVLYETDFGLQLNAGVRLNNHSEYDSKFVYNVNPSFLVETEALDYKILGSYSTAYITPSLYQLYDPLYGNLELLPEENRTIEGGVELSGENGFRFSALYFNRESSDYIDFVSVDPEIGISQYRNIDETFQTDGVEVEVANTFFEVLNFQANYTFTQPDKRFALRIPKHKVNASFGYSLQQKTQFGLTFQYVSDREDSFFNPDTFEQEITTLDAFSLLNANVSHPINEVMTVTFGIENIFNSAYEELYRYQTRGRNVRLGVTFQF
ncbi:TonB-dependent receptor plug domain-containing protein [Luteirhabdus pelagi]|uniref:TonB-dependent receptor plug domain-containing protein n=1 Tax=Luteirhabdus pelagi TaxID=2792783 RepID=UPI001939A43C|nr:TonB-dependent receptor plug domain-containing protein [Luteirhabdus pelagi]